MKAGRILSFIAIFMAAAFIGKAQDHKRTAIWYFGENAGLDFNTEPPTPRTDGQINTDEGCATLCDTAGVLLLYTDGMTVWNRNHQVMQNGTGLLGDGSSSQGVIIIPQPGNDSIFYIFTTDDRGGLNGLTYSIANLNANNGSGVIESKNVLLVTPVTEALSAVYHNNGKDVWVICHGFGNNYFYNYLLTSQGIQKCPVVSASGSIISGNPGLAQMAMKVSVDNIVANTFYTSIQGKVELHQLNPIDGRMELLHTLPGLVLPIGMEFSPDGKFLYVVERDNNLFQFDLSQTTSQGISDSRKNIFSTSNDLKFALQLANNHRIYLSIKDSLSLTSINSPNLPDTASHIQFEGQNISPRKAKIGLPNFVASYFFMPAVNFSYQHDCRTNIIDFKSIDTFSATLFSWRIIRQSTQNNETSSDQNLTFTFPDTGLYDITLIASNGTTTDSISRKIHIKPKYVLNLGSDTVLCEGSTIELNAGNGQYCYKWHDGSTDPTFLLDTAGQYHVTVTTNNFCTYSDTIEIHYSSYPAKPGITRSNDTLFSTSADSYQWYKNGDIINNANDSFYRFTENGYYHVLAINNSGCKTISDSFYITGVGINKLNATDYFKIYPNPARQHITIDGTRPIDNIRMINQFGQIYNFKVTVPLEVSHLPGGIYYIEITDTLKNTYTTKIVIH